METVKSRENKWFYVSFFIFAAFIISFQLILHFAPEAVSARSKGLELTSWEYCLPNDNTCALKPAKVPGSLEVKGYSPKEIYLKTIFNRPVWCGKLNSCALLVGTVSDPAEVFLNDQKIGDFARPKRNPKYSQTYPLNLRIAGTELKHQKNKLEVKIYPLYKHNHGLIRGPVKIMPLESATVISSLIISHTIVLPLISSILLTVIGLIALLIAIQAKESDVIFFRWFIAYTLIMGLYAFSLTRIPRELMPPTVGVDLHFALRTLSEFIHINLILSLFRRKLLPFKILGYGHLLIGLSLFFGAIFYFINPDIGSTLSSNGKLIFRKSVMLYSLSPLLAIYLSFKYIKTNKNLGIFIPVYILVALMVISDFLALNGIIEDIYFVRSYPLLISLSYAFYLWNFYSGKRRAGELNREIGQISSQLAHDIKSPLTALNMVAGSSKNLPEAEKSLIFSAIKRIEGISSDLLEKRNNKKSIDKLSHINLVNLIQEMMREKELEFLNKDITFHFNPTTEEASLSVMINLIEVKRMLSNIFNNSIDAIETKGLITIEINSSKKMIEVSILDNGKGIPKNLINTIFDEGVSSKNKGSGLGLYHARKVMHSNRGDIKVSSDLGKGTIITLIFSTEN